MTWLSLSVFVNFPLERLYKSRKAEVLAVNLATEVDSPALSREESDYIEGLVTNEE